MRKEATNQKTGISPLRTNDSRPPMADRRGTEAMCPSICAERTLRGVGDDEGKSRDFYRGHQLHVASSVGITRFTDGRQLSAKRTRPASTRRAPDGHQISQRYVVHYGPFWSSSLIFYVADKLG